MESVGCPHGWFRPGWLTVPGYERTFQGGHVTHAGDDFFSLQGEMLSSPAISEVSSGGWPEIPVEVDGEYFPASTVFQPNSERTLSVRGSSSGRVGALRVFRGQWL